MYVIFFGIIYFGCLNKMRLVLLDLILGVSFGGDLYNIRFFFSLFFRIGEVFGFIILYD